MSLNHVQPGTDSRKHSHTQNVESNNKLCYCFNSKTTDSIQRKQEKHGFSKRYI